RALTRSRTTLGYLDPRHGWLVIDSGNRKTVELFTHALRKTLGSLAVTGLRSAAAPAAVMTSWLADGGPPADVTLEDECELRDESDGGIVRCKGQDLTGDEIRAHLQARKQATRLGLTWNRRLALVLADDLTIRRLRFLDVIREQAGDAESELERRDAEFALMSGELALFLPRLMEMFGGPAP
ncbi:MAG: recombination-associated protein RdgC, partial [Pseudomonadota bacterium]|nr:recombination-associated protein RdgC [Pseudomonadota bacterium]